MKKFKLINYSIVLSYSNRIYFLLFIFLTIFIITIAIQLKSHVIHYISGSLGILCGFFVITKFLRNKNPQSAAATLLFYRTICDIGIALRFIFGPIVDLQLCGKLICELSDLTTNTHELDRACNAPASILEFFEIASEAWFLCMAIDLAIILVNPFSPFRKRIIFYHIFCWGSAGFLATLVSIIPNVAGLWIINPDIAASYICWLKSTSSHSDFQPWVFIYIPIVGIYSYALYVLICAKHILKKGIPMTFLHRIRTLDTSRNMLTIFSLYYACVVCLGVLTSTVKEFWPALIFTFSTKGFLCLIVFLMMESSFQIEQNTIEYPNSNQEMSTINTNPTLNEFNNQKHNSIKSLNSVHTTTTTNTTTNTSPNSVKLSSYRGEDQATVLYDLNIALQHEVVTYATVGIQQCASLSYQNMNRPSGLNNNHRNSHNINNNINNNNHNTSNYHDLFQSFLTTNQNHPPRQFSRTFTNTTAQSHLTNLTSSREHYTIQIIVPEDKFVIDNDRFQSLARGTIKDLQRALQATSETMSVSALKSILQTKVVYNDYVDDDKSNYGESEMTSTYHPTNSIPKTSYDRTQHQSVVSNRPNSWMSYLSTKTGISLGIGNNTTNTSNNNNNNLGIDKFEGNKREPSSTELKTILLEESLNHPHDKTQTQSSDKNISSNQNIQILPLNETNLLKQSQINITSVNRPSDMASETFPRKNDSVYNTVIDWMKRLPNRMYRQLRTYSILLDLNRGVQFTEYCPTIFREIRRIYGIEHTYAASFEQQVENRVTEGGASSALFFYSKCNKFIVKSCTVSEMEQIRSNAHLLRDHFQNNPKSFITKIFGAYKLQMYACDLYFIVTNNILKTQNNEIISEKYDLKGSSVYRNMKPPKSGQRLRCKGCGQWFIYSSRSHLSTRNKSSRFTSTIEKDDLMMDSEQQQLICPLFAHEPDSILKDNDMRGRSKLRLPKLITEKMLIRLKIDTEFLSKVYQTMDYSLLVGVYKRLIDYKSTTQFLPQNTINKQNDHNDNQNDINDENNEDEFGNTRLQATEYFVDYSFYIGIIDYQQRYNWRKKVENWVKVHIMRQPKDELSCIDPIRYADRFQEFIEDLML